MSKKEMCQGCGEEVESDKLIQVLYNNFYTNYQDFEPWYCPKCHKRYLEQGHGVERRKKTMRLTEL